MTLSTRLHRRPLLLLACFAIFAVVVASIGFGHQTARIFGHNSLLRLGRAGSSRLVLHSSGQRDVVSAMTAPSVASNRKQEASTRKQGKTETGGATVREQTPCSGYPVKFFVNDDVHTYRPCELSCSNATYLLLLGFSAANDTSARAVVRDTWGSAARTRDDVAMAFIVGDPQDDNVASLLDDEARVHGDVIRADFTDTYGNLTRKSLAALHAASALCRPARYVMKVDSDVFVNVPGLLRHLAASDGARLLLGSVHEGGRPVRTRGHRWYVAREAYAPPTYPPYVHGPGYVMSADLPPLLYAASRSLPIFNMEDIYVTGMLAARVGVRVTHTPRFYEQRRWALRYVGNPASALYLHSLSADEIRRAWRNLVSRT